MDSSTKRNCQRVPASQTTFLWVDKNILSLPRARFDCMKDIAAISLFVLIRGWQLSETYVYLKWKLDNGRWVSYIRVEYSDCWASLDQIRRVTASKPVVQANGEESYSQTIVRRAMTAPLGDTNPSAHTSDIDTQATFPLRPVSKQVTVRPKNRRPSRTFYVVIVAVVILCLLLALFAWVTSSHTGKPSAVHPVIVTATATIMGPTRPHDSPSPPIRQLTAKEITRPAPWTGHWVVAENQSISAIAAALGQKSYDQIATDNHLLDPNIINVGQELLVVLGKRQILQGGANYSYVIVSQDIAIVARSAVIVTGSPSPPFYYRMDYEQQARKLYSEVNNEITVASTYRIYKIDSSLTTTHECIYKEGGSAITDSRAVGLLKQCNG